MCACMYFFSYLLFCFLFFVLMFSTLTLVLEKCLLYELLLLGYGLSIEPALLKINNIPETIQFNTEFKIKPVLLRQVMANLRGLQQEEVSGENYITHNPTTLQ